MGLKSSHAYVWMQPGVKMDDKKYCGYVMPSYWWV